MLGAGFRDLKRGSRRCPATFARRSFGFAAALWCSLCVVTATPSWAGWSRTTIVNQPSSCAYQTEPALDAHGDRWVACELRGGGEGLFVGRVTSRYRLTAVQLVPGTVGLGIGETSLGIDAGGTAVLAWRFANPNAGADPSYGTAAVMWRLGHPPAAPRC
jgi:hypothetical protein